MEKYNNLFTEKNNFTEKEEEIKNVHKKIKKVTKVYVPGKLIVREEDNNRYNINETVIWYSFDPVYVKTDKKVDRRYNFHIAPDSKTEVGKNYIEDCDKLRNKLIECLEEYKGQEIILVKGEGNKPDWTKCHKWLEVKFDGFS